MLVVVCVMAVLAVVFSSQKDKRAFQRYLKEKPPGYRSWSPGACLLYEVERGVWASLYAGGMTFFILVGIIVVGLLMFIGFASSDDPGHSSGDLEFLEELEEGEYTAGAVDAGHSRGVVLCPSRFKLGGFHGALDACRLNSRGNLFCQEAMTLAHCALSITTALRD